MLRFSDARNFGRTLTGLALIAGPALMLVASIVTPNTDNDNKLKELNNVAAHKSAYLWGSVLFLLGTLTLLAASVGIIHLFRNTRVTLGQIAGSLLLVGTAVTTAFYAFSVVEYEMVNQPGLNRAELAKFLHESNQTAAGAPLFILFLLGIVLGLILLAIALAKQADPDLGRGPDRDRRRGRVRRRPGSDGQHHRRRAAPDRVRDARADRALDVRRGVGRSARAADRAGRAPRDRVRLEKETARHSWRAVSGGRRDALFLSSGLDLWGKSLRGGAVPGREAERQERHAGDGQEQCRRGVAREAHQHAPAQQPDHDAAIEGEVGGDGQRAPFGAGGGQRQADDQSADHDRDDRARGREPEQERRDHREHAGQKLERAVRGKGDESEGSHVRTVWGKANARSVSSGTECPRVLGSQCSVLSSEALGPSN